MKGFGLTKSLLEATAKILNQEVEAVVEDVELEEGRGKKGRARHASDEYADEWGDKNSAKKSTTQRGGKRELDESEETLEEGRGKKGAARHAKDDSDGEWGDDKPAKKTTTVRGGKREVSEEALEEGESPTKGTRLISKHEGKDGHHAEVRKSSEWDEYQVHHYHNGKHLGEGPVSYHDDKKDATDTANYEIKNFKVKGKSLVKEDIDSDLIIFNDEYGIGTIVEMTDEMASIVYEGHFEEIALEDIFVEEVEQIDELSVETLRSYSSKASAQAGEKKRGKPSAATIAMKAKRGAGLENAGKKLKAASEAAHAKHREHINNLTNDLGAHFSKELPALMSKHGFEKVNSHPDVDTYLHKHDNGHCTLISHHKTKKGYQSTGDSGHELKSMNTKGASWSGHTAHKWVYDDADAAKEKTNSIPKAEAHIIDVKENGANDRSW